MQLQSPNIYNKVWERSRNTLSSLSRSEDAQGSMDEKKIETTHALGSSVSYRRVMEVKQAIARVVCKHYIQDDVVIPTNLWISVYITHDVENLDGRNKGFFFHGEFHGTALSVTRHLSWDNLGKKAKSCPEWSHWLINSQAARFICSSPLVQMEERTTLFAPLSNNRPVRPLHNLVHGAKVKDESQLKYVSSLLQQGVSLGKMSWSPGLATNRSWLVWSL